MGSTNDLLVKTICQSCGKNIESVIQFKFGGMTQEPYSLGDKISWELPRGIGEQGLSKVAVSGITLECPCCGKEPFRVAEVAIVVEKDRIASIEADAGRFDFSKASWLSLEE